VLVRLLPLLPIPVLILILVVSETRPFVDGAPHDERFTAGTSAGGMADVLDLAAPAATAGDSDGVVPSGARARVHVSDIDSVYDVEGTTVAAILDSIRLHGPHDGEGRWAASTSWTFGWSYEPAVAEGCRVETATVNLALRYTLPHWISEAAADPVVVGAWSRYLGNVTTHEQGHAAIARDAADDLKTTLEAIVPQPTCKALAGVVGDTVHAALDRHAQVQAEYDRQTQHGVVQGAVLSVRP
jgi:predicted secreted Zn-dependent protease